MTVVITLCPGIALGVTGTYSKGEPDVNIGESFEVDSVELIGGDLFELLEWADGAYNHSILPKIEELCIEQAKQ